MYRVTGIAEDITERRRADESLRRLAAAIEGISEIVTLYDTDDRLVLFNQAFCDINRAVKDNILLGMSFEELMRTLIAGGMVPEAAGREEAWLQERLERHRNPPGPFEVARQDGIWLLTNEQRLRDGGNITISLNITERKRAEDALRVSEGQVRLLMNSTAEAIYGIDLEGNCSFANQACAGMLGYDRAEDLLGKHMHDLIHHTRHDGTRYPAEECLIYQAFARGEGTHVENEVLWRRDGTSFPAEYWSHPVRRDGEVVAVVVTFLDITERRQAEVALQESEARLSSFINNIPNAIYLKDTKGRYVLVNASAMKQYGLPKNRLIGKTVYDIHSKGEADATVKQDREVLKQGIPIEAERELTYPDGSKHTIIAVKFPVRGESGEINSIGGINIDITERKRAEAALRESDARLRDAIESISEGFILYDADDRLVLCNSKYRDFYPSIADILKPSAKLEDLARTAFEAGAVQGSAENVEAWMKMRLKQHRTGQGTHEQHLADGRWVLCSERKTSGGGTVGIRTDITERLRAEEQLRQAQKLEAVGQLTGGIAHDFNNLLTIIIGNLDMLDDHLGDDPPARNFAQSALKATFRGAELTQQLLAFSRKQTLAPKLTDANGLVSSMTELMRRSLAENIEIETVLAGGIWKAVVDRGQLENALLNLAINARDAMPEGGKLTLKTANRHLDADDPDTPAEAATGPYVVISVSDTGTGMTPEVIEHVFEPFFTTKGVGEGSGLGLSMVYGFIKQSGGHIAIHSEVGRGTTVALYLPKAAALDEGEAAAERKPKALPRGEETVLVVEDDPDVRAFVTNALAGLGYDVLEADDGPSVLSLLDDLPDIDLLVSDVVLPGGMNGLQIAEAIRRLRPRIKVLFTSGYAQSAIVHHGQLDEGVELLAKPFTREALARRVREVLDAAGEG